MLMFLRALPPNCALSQSMSLEMHHFLPFWCAEVGWKNLLQPSVCRGPSGLATSCGRGWDVCMLQKVAHLRPLPRQQPHLHPAGAVMMWITYRSLLSTEGFLDMEAHESDLRGSRGVFMAGSLTLFMGVCNMKNTFATLLVKRRWEAWVLGNLSWRCTQGRCTGFGWLESVCCAPVSCWLIAGARGSAPVQAASQEWVVQPAVHLGCCSCGTRWHHW